jgi:LuxR family maltose regulon positive regulatory protein
MSVLVWIGLLTQAKLKAARRDFSGALKILDQMERDFEGMDPHVFQALCTSYKVLWKMEQGDLTGLTDWLRRMDLNVEKKIGTDRFVDLALAARFLCALDRCKEALQILEKVEKIARDNEFAGWLVSILVLQAVAWKKMRNEARAVECLEQALELAEPEGYVRVFLDQGQPIHETLRLVQKKGSGSQYVTRLLAAFQPNSPGKRVTASEPDLLSQRELDVLKLLAQGCPDKQIAETLVIARETVHKHLKNIYGKLGVHSRTEAIARAHELDLL